MKLYKGYSPKYLSGYLFYLVPENIHFIRSQGIGYYNNEENTVIHKVKLFHAEDPLTPIRIPNETV